jgi:hypothetical protein
MEEPLMSTFTQAEAQAKVGKRIRTKAGWSGVSTGTLGTVMSIDQMSPRKMGAVLEEAWDVIIEWDSPNRRRTLTDWFTKEEYEKFLIEEN